MVVVGYRPGWDGLSEAVDFDGNARAAVGALDAHGVSQAVVVGHSFGAGVATWLAAFYPERVRALVLVSPGANTAALDWFDGVLATPFAGALLSAGMMAGVGAALAVGASRRAIARGFGLDEDFLRAGSRLLLRPSAWRAFVVEQRSLFRDLPVLETRLESITVPTTIVSGDADRVVTPAAARLLASQIPDAELVMLPGAGHLLPHQHGDMVAEAIVRASAGS